MPRGVTPVVAPVAVAAVVLIAVVGEPFWLVALGCVIVALGIAAAVADETRRRRVVRAWDHVPAAAVAPFVDVAALAAVRTHRDELQAVAVLRRAVPGVPLRRARGLVAELTGVASGAKA